jgi:hypothetical protein
VNPVSACKIAKNLKIAHPFLQPDVAPGGYPLGSSDRASKIHGGGSMGVETIPGTPGCAVSARPGKPRCGFSGFGFLDPPTRVSTISREHPGVQCVHVRANPGVVFFR